MGNRWLTPDHAPVALASRCIFIPDAVDWLAIVAGALLPLTYAYEFEPFGTATPEETAEAFQTMFDGFSFNTGVCRVIGEIVTVAGSVNPNPGNWLPCDGALVSNVDYPALWGAIGTTYGGTGSTSFAVPDLRGRVAIGVSGSFALGDNGGETDHTLIEAEMPAHVHSTGNSLLLGTSVPPPLDALGPNPLPAFTGSTGGSGAHNNMQPYLVLQPYIVGR